jgi:glycerol-3-phosphate dehydrogenase subunit B
VPGIRQFRALRAHLRKNGGRIQIGEAVHGSIGADRLVTSLNAPAAAREFVVRTGAVVLATGGIAGGGIVARADGTLVEMVLDLPVVGPAGTSWLLSDPFDPAGHALETAGIATDDELRPIAAGRAGAGPAGDRRIRRATDPLADNVRIVGSLLAGQRYLRERCGDGVAIASGLFAARSLGAAAGPLKRHDRALAVGSSLP